jgi:hypothetical protein
MKDNFWPVLCWKTLMTGVLLLGAPALAAHAQTSIFSIQNTPNPNRQGNTVNAVTAISPNDAWAVGYANSNNLNESRTLTMHWDGTAWKVVASPNPGNIPACRNSNTGNFLNAVAGSASNDVWAVGFSFTCTGAALRPMALHWDGNSWQVVNTPKLNSNDNSAFNGVAALAADNVYAVGYTPAKNGAVLTLVEHWDGSAWSVVPTPNANHTGDVLNSITANSATDIWAVGDQVAPNTPVKTLALHFDGINWTIVSTPNVAQGGDLDQNVLTGVQAISAGDVTASGFVVNSRSLNTLTLIEHWDGNSWSIVPSPNQSQAAGAFNTLRGIAAVSGSDMYAVGYFGDAATTGQQETLIEHFDGAAWNIVPSPTRGIAQQLNGVFVLPASGNIWVVGGWSPFGDDPETGLLQVPRTIVMFSPIG